MLSNTEPGLLDQHQKGRSSVVERESPKLRVASSIEVLRYGGVGVVVTHRSSEPLSGVRSPHSLIIMKKHEMLNLKSQYFFYLKISSRVPV